MDVSCLYRLNLDDIELVVYDSLKKLKYSNSLTFVLLHGSPGQISNWKYIIKLLESQYRVIAFDLRGYGLSSKPEKISLKDYLSDLRYLLNESGISDKDAVLVGHSFGGLVAQEYAARYTVKGLVLIGSVVRLKPDFIDRIIWHLPPFLWRKILFTENFLTRKIYRDLFFSKKTSDDVFEEFIRDNKEYLEALPPHSFRYLRYFSGYNASNSVSKIKVPTLIIVGSDDKVTSPEHSRELHVLIKNSELVVVPDAGHLILYEKPELIVEMLLRFVKKL